jgi:YgiT-type zinc finger domain-containing protein
MWKPITSSSLLKKLSEDETMLEITVCPVCDGKIKKVKEDWVGEFKGKEYIVPDLEYYICEACGERIYMREAMRKIEAYSPAYHLPEPA